MQGKKGVRRRRVRRPNPTGRKGKEIPPPKERKPKAAAVVVIARRRRVARLLTRRVSLSEIARLEKVSETTVYRDMLAIRKSWAKQAKLARSVERAIEDMLALSNEIQREAWQLLYGTKLDAVKVGCLRTLQQERSEIIAVLQDLGALPKQAEKLDITDWRQSLRKIAAERQQRAEAPFK